MCIKDIVRSSQNINFSECHAAYFINIEPQVTSRWSDSFVRMIYWRAVFPCMGTYICKRSASYVHVDTALTLITKDGC